MTLLEVEGLSIRYGDLQAVHAINFNVAKGETVALVGANGAGKSTLLRSLAGLQDSSAGVVRFNGEDVTQTPAESMSRLGLAMVPEGRLLFDTLTVEENLAMGATVGRKGYWSQQRVCELFPILEERRKSFPSQLSGGQQQMVAIGRALMSNPELLLCDEISLGLAPIVIGQLYESFSTITREGMSLVIVEQDVRRALNASNRIYCLMKGSVKLHAESKSVTIDNLTEAYFGH